MWPNHPPIWAGCWADPAGVLFTCVQITSFLGFVCETLKSNMMFVVAVSVGKVTCSPPTHTHIHTDSLMGSLGSLHISAGCDQFSVRCSPHSSHQNPRKARDISDYKSTSGCYIRLKGQQLILILSKTLVPSGRHSGATA